VKNHNTTEPVTENEIKMVSVAEEHILSSESGSNSSVVQPQDTNIADKSSTADKIPPFEEAQTTVISIESPALENETLTTEASIIRDVQNTTEDISSIMTSKISEKASEEKGSENPVSATEVTTVNQMDAVTSLPSADSSSLSADANNQTAENSSERSTIADTDSQGKVSLFLVLILKLIISLI
jgi:hypothetical protein